jgi:hypothetical protein
MKKAKCSTNLIFPGLSSPEFGHKIFAKIAIFGLIKLLFLMQKWAQGSRIHQFQQDCAMLTLISAISSNFKMILVGF